MTERDAFRFTEKCLYDYPANNARLDVLREDLRTLRGSCDVKAQNYQYTFSFTGEKSDPVFSHVLKVEKCEREIHRLLRYTKPITRLREDMTSSYALDGSRNTDYLKILDLFYFGNNTIATVLGLMHWSRGTFFNRRRSLVMRAKGYLGI